MSHPSDRRSDGPADRRFERNPDRPSDRPAPRRQDGRGDSPADGRSPERRRFGPQDRPFGSGATSRWGGAALRGRRPAGAAGPDRSAGPGLRDGGRADRPDRPGPGGSGRRSFRDAPRRGPRGEFGAGGDRRGGFFERRGASRDRAGGERPFGDERGAERRAGGERWAAASAGRFPGSRRPDRPARPGPPLRSQQGGPRLFELSPAAPVEAESHAPAAPADLIWGRHSALAALEAGRPLHRIWCTSELRFSPRFLQLLREAKASGVLLEEVTWARLGQISGGAVHQGIVLQPAAAATLQLDTLIEGCRQLGESPLLIAVDGLTDPQNLGAIVRSAEALGAHGLVLPQRRNAGLTGSVAKVAAGALEHLPVARVVNLNRSLDSLKQEGYRVIGLAAEGTATLEEADLSGPLVLVTGSEAEGLSLLTRRSCDQLVRIPLRGTTPSLNASVATALLLYEVARRSWMAGLRGTAPAPRLERPALPEPEPSAAAADASAAAAVEAMAFVEANAPSPAVELLGSAADDEADQDAAESSVDAMVAPSLEPPAPPAPPQDSAAGDSFQPEPAHAQQPLGEPPLDASAGPASASLEEPAPARSAAHEPASDLVPADMPREPEALAAVAVAAAVSPPPADLDEDTAAAPAPTQASPADQLQAARTIVVGTPAFDQDVSL